MVSKEQRYVMGAYIRHQRRIADLSMRQVSAMVGISNPYLSQIERGLRAPSEAVATGIATALGVSVDELYEHDDPEAPSSPADSQPSKSGNQKIDLLEAIEQAKELSLAQRTSLAEIYRSFLRSNTSDESAPTNRVQDAEDR